MAHLWVNLASGPGSIGDAIVQWLLASGAIAVWELNPFALVLFRKLDDLDLRRIILILVNLDERWWYCFHRPLRVSQWLSVHVPVTVWSGSGCAWIDMSVLENDNLVLVVLERDLVVENWVEYWSCLPVSVVLTPLLLVSLLSGWNWLWEWLWRCFVWIVALAGSDNSVAQVICERNFIRTEGSITAVWQLDPLRVELNQGGWLSLVVMEWGALHDDVLAEVLVAIHTGGILLVESESTLAPEKQ